MHWPFWNWIQAIICQMLMQVDYDLWIFSMPALWPGFFSKLDQASLQLQTQPLISLETLISMICGLFCLKYVWYNLLSSEETWREESDKEARKWWLAISTLCKKDENIYWVINIVKYFVLLLGFSSNSSQLPSWNVERLLQLWFALQGRGYHHMMPQSQLTSTQ